MCSIKMSGVPTVVGVNDVEGLTRNERILRWELVERSEATTWAAMLEDREWHVDFIEQRSEGEKCLCSKNPIHDLVHLQNDNTGKKAIVGNCCIEKIFSGTKALGMGQNAAKIFKSVKHVQREQQRLDAEGAADDARPPSFNMEAIEWAFEEGHINQWEFTFYSDTIKKRQLSDKQRPIKKRINKKVCDALHMIKPKPRLDAGVSMWTQAEVEFGMQGNVLNEWEKNFVSQNKTRTTFTEKQMPIVKRIKAKLTTSMSSSSSPRRSGPAAGAA